MVPDLKLLGWSKLDVNIGHLSGGKESWERIAFDWQPGDIRNCSYAPAKAWIVVSCEDRTHGGQVLALHDLTNGTTTALQRMTGILRNAINPAGSLVCYTTPARESGATDVHLLDLEARQPRPLGYAVAHDSTPAWFTDNRRMAFHTPRRRIEIATVPDAEPLDVTAGTHPAVSHDGKRLAFLRDGRVNLWRLDEGSAQPVEIRTRGLETELLDTLSWSPDDQWLSFGVSTGVTGKESAFYLYDVVNRQQLSLGVKYLSGMIIM